MIMHPTSAAASTLPKPANVSTFQAQAIIEVLHAFESQTAKGHSVIAQPGERYALIDQTDPDWWFVTKQVHNINDGFYLPRTYVKSVATSALAAFRPQSMTLPAGSSQFTTNNIASRRPGFWLATGGKRQSSITAAVFGGADDHQSEPELTYYNSKTVTGEHKFAPKPDDCDVPIKELSGGWRQYIDSASGRTYYYHPGTEASTWKPPRSMLAPEQLAQLRVSSDSTCSEEHPTTTLDDSLPSSLELLSSASIPAPDSRPPVPSPSGKPRHLIRSRNGSSASGSDAGQEETVVHCHPSPDIVRTSRSGSQDGNQHDMVINNNHFNNIHDALQRTLSTDQMKLKEGPIDKYEVEEKNSKQVANAKHKKMAITWVPCYALLNSHHMIFYKDQKSAQRVKHYETPLCAVYLRGSKLRWIEGDKKRKHIFAIEHNDGIIHLSSSDVPVVNEWFHAINSAIRRLPPVDVQAERIITSLSSIVQRRSLLVPQTKSTIQSCTNQPALPGPSINSIKSDKSDTDTSANERPKQRRSFTQRKAQISSPQGQTNNGIQLSDEHKAQKASILDKLRKFFRARPSLESVIAKGIYKPEPVFGSSLTLICEREKCTLPRFVAVATKVIEERGLDADGLYRISGNLSAVQRIRCQVDQDKYTALLAESDVHVLTGALKLFFRELQEPVVPTNLATQFLNTIRKSKVKERREDFKLLLAKMPPEHRDTIHHLFAHLLKVAAKSSVNRMQIHNLAIVFGPTLFASNGGASKTQPNAKDKKERKSTSASNNAEKPASNSHLAYHMIMHGQIVEQMLNDFDHLFTGPLPTVNVS